MVSLDFEHEAGDMVVGVDEAGRGPLAGGVYAAAVSLPIARAEMLLVGGWSAVNDSKRLSEKRRVALAETIKATADCRWCVASASPAEIDRLNILRASHLAMRRAVEGLGLVGKVTILVDGLPVPGLPFPSRNIVKGDAKSLLIAAASILAKTERDADCLRLEARYPGYGFARHKGYPTRDHLRALAELGPCPEHRRSFGSVNQLLLPLGVDG
jgi:ribonuclease HII